MTTRLLAFAALLSLAAHGSLAVAQQNVMAQQGPNGQCNCPKCQAARQATAENSATRAAQPAGLFSAEPTGIFAPNNSFFGSSQKPSDVQQAGHHHAHHAAPGYCPPGAVGGHHMSGPYNRHLGTGHPFNGGRYGSMGGAHGTPGYPHHHHHREYVGPQGPPSAQVAYPYYTTRGPRDFLLDNPPSIGR